MARLVLALGGNALGISPQQQIANARIAASTLVDLVTEGHEVVVSHGNGPQVGVISKAFEIAMDEGAVPEGFDLPEASAMSQGYIGYHLVQTLRNEFRRRGRNDEIVQVTTQVLVDPADVAFKEPTKPVGSFYSEPDAREQMGRDPRLQMKEDSGRGWRRVVASPQPLEIIEAFAITTLVNSGTLVITCGGGGVPVIREPDGTLRGVPAVIDKDFCSELLAEQLEADTLVILTAVDKVALNFGTSEQRNLDELRVDELDQLINEGQFAAGSILPKVQAAAKFVRSGNRRTSIICELTSATEALRGHRGTLIRG